MISSTILRFAWMIFFVSAPFFTSVCTAQTLHNPFADTSPTALVDAPTPQTPELASTAADVESSLKGDSDPLPQRIGITGSTQLSLDEVIQRVLSNNQDIALSQVAVRQSRWNVQFAKSAFDPTFNASANQKYDVEPATSLLSGSANGSGTTRTYSFNSKLNGFAPWFGSSYDVQFNSQRVTSNNLFNSLVPQYPTALTFDFTQPLLRNLRFDDRRMQIEVARKNQSLSEAQFQQKVIDTVTQAVQVYWQLRFAWRNIEVQTEGLRLAQEQTKSNERRVDAGVLAPVSVIEAQTQVANNEQSTFQAQLALTTAEVALKKMMLSDAADPLWAQALIPTSDFDISLPEGTVEEIVQKALSARSELEQNHISDEINQSKIRAAKNQLKPQLDLTASYTANGLAGLAKTDPVTIPGFGTFSLSAPEQLVGGYGKSVSNLFEQKYPTITVGLQWNMPVRNRAAQSTLSVAREQASAIKLDKEQLQQSVQADVRKALQRVASAQASLRSAVRSSKLAEDLYASEQRKFKAGTTTMFMISQRQTAMINARTQVLDTQMELSNAISQYHSAVGSTLEVRAIHIQP